MTPGQAAYVEYCDGVPVRPSWEELTQAQRESWHSIAKCALRVVCGSTDVAGRETYEAYALLFEIEQPWDRLMPPLRGRWTRIALAARSATPDDKPERTAEPKTPGEAAYHVYWRRNDCGKWINLPKHEKELWESIAKGARAIEVKSLGQTAYEAYAKSVGDAAPWRCVEQGVWESVAKATIEEAIRRGDVRR